MHSFTFNGHSSDEFGIRIERFPDLNRSERKYRSASVSGRNGNIYQMQDAWEEVTVSYQIFAGERQAGAAVSDFTEIVEWLNSADDYAVLTDTYDPEHYRLAVFVDELEIESQWHTFGKATVRFRCRPQRYLASANLLPKMSAGTYTNGGITATVDASGNITFSGRTTSFSSSVDIPLDNAFTITQSMVDNGAILYIDSSTDGLSTIEPKGVNASFPAYTLSSSISTPVRAEDVGETITYYRVYGAGANQTVSGSFTLEIKTDYPEIVVEDGDVVNNPTNHIAHPIITLTGSEAHPNLLNLETPYNISSDAELSIWNTEWTDNIFFFAGGAYSTGFHGITYTQATASSRGGTLTTHDNTTGTLTFTSFASVGVAGIGRGIALTPDSDYTLTCTTSSGRSEVYVFFFEAGGTNAYNSFAYTEIRTAGTLSITFHVPPTCSNTLIVYVRPLEDEGTFSSIRLVTGTSEQPFSEYLPDGIVDTLTLGDTTLTFGTKGFSEAVIDCERENFTVDGINYNNQSIITDQYGNISVDYLRLVSGTNTVSFTNNVITAVEMDPRFWEL